MAGTSAGAGGPQSADIGAHILIIEGRFYEGLADDMAAGAIAVLEKHGCTWERVGVPGALEISQVLTAALETGRFEELEEGTTKPFDGAIAIGCVIRGETYHFELVANESGAGVTRVALDHQLPVANAILTVENEAQAWARAADKGRDAARVAVEMANLLDDLK